MSRSGPVSFWRHPRRYLRREWRLFRYYTRPDRVLARVLWGNRNHPTPRTFLAWILGPKRKARIRRNVAGGSTAWGANREGGTWKAVKGRRPRTYKD